MTTEARRPKRNDPLDQAFIRFQKLLPERPARLLCYLHDPDARYLRMPVGILLFIGGCFWFLPVLGLEMLPIGLLLIAQDIPFMRKPVGKAMIPLLDGTEHLIRKWKARRFSWPIRLARSR